MNNKMWEKLSRDHFYHVKSLWASKNFSQLFPSSLPYFSWIYIVFSCIFCWLGYLDFVNIVKKTGRTLIYLRLKNAEIIWLTFLKLQFYLEEMNERHLLIGNSSGKKGNKSAELTNISSLGTQRHQISVQ